MKNEKITNQNQIKEVAKQISSGSSFSDEYIEKILRKYEKNIEIEINLYNIDNELITWYNIDDDRIIMFFGQQLQGISLSNDKFLNNVECETILGIFEV